MIVMMLVLVDLAPAQAGRFAINRDAEEIKKILVDPQEGASEKFDKAVAYIDKIRDDKNRIRDLKNVFVSYVSRFPQPAFYAILAYLRIVASDKESYSKDLSDAISDFETAVEMEKDDPKTLATKINILLRRERKELVRGPMIVPLNQLPGKPDLSRCAKPTLSEFEWDIYDQTKTAIARVVRCYSDARKVREASQSGEIPVEERAELMKKADALNKVGDDLMKSTEDEMRVLVVEYPTNAKRLFCWLQEMFISYGYVVSDVMTK